MHDQGTLTAHGRLRLVVNALARQDEAEAKRLYESCPDESLEKLDAALDKVVGFLVVNLLMAGQHSKSGDDQAGTTVANLLAAAHRFCADIEIPLQQLAAINPQLGELVADLSPLAADVPADDDRVAELLESLRSCWEAWE